jgi:hypothetical protein
VQHVDRVGELRQVEDAKRASLIPNPNLFARRPTVFMGFQSSGSRPFCTWSN